MNTLLSRTCLILGLAGLAACSKPAPQAASETAVSVAPPASVVQGSTAAPTSATAPADISLKAGLWQVTYARPEMGYSSVQQICVDAGLAKTLAERNDELEAMPCSRHDVTETGGGTHIERVCEHNDTTVTSHIDIRFDGDGAFHQTMETLYDPAFAGHADTHTSADGGWLGDCSAGMKPGDIMMPDGSKATLG